MATIQKNYARTVSRGRLTQEAMDKRISMITPTLNIEDFKDADYVVEAVYEDMDVKKEMFKKLDAVCKQLYHLPGGCASGGGRRVRR